MFHKIKSAKAIDDHNIDVVFVDGIKKTYNAINIIQKFKELKDINLFKKARVDIGGYGIVWNENIDVSSDTVYYD